ncbi:hypothetical protein EMGBS6_13670 [Opitutia bacterium]|nr:hypothetical protein EMGBS6_13670 [Opitutae bacterium]
MARKVAATSGPLPAGHEIKGAEVIVTLAHADGLKTRDGAPAKSFQLAGADKQWKPAVAKIDGAKLIVTSGEVAAPIALRYAWLDNPETKPREFRRPARLALPHRRLGPASRARSRRQGQR